MSGKRSTHSFLIERVVAPARPWPAGDGAPTAFSISRRRFVAGAGGAALLAATAFIPDRPKVYLRARSAVIEYGGHRWILRIPMFGSAARATLLKQDGLFQIALTAARLPGSARQFELLLRIFAEAGEWFIGAQVKQWEYEGVATLSEWLGGASPIKGVSRAWSLDVGGVGLLTPAHADVNLWAPFRFAIAAGEQGLELCNALTGAVSHIDVSLADSSAESLRGTLSTTATSGPATLLRAQGNVGANGLGAPDRSGQGFQFIPEGELRCVLEAFDGRSSGNSVALIEGAGELRLSAGSARSHPLALQLERAAVLCEPGPLCRNAAAAGRVARTSQAVEVCGVQACIAGLDEHPLYVAVKDGRRSAVHVGVRLREIWLPSGDADSATIAFADRPVTLQIPGEAPAPEAPAMGAATPAPAPVMDEGMVVERPHPSSGELIVAGEQGFMLASSSDAKFHFKRGADLFNLAFEFTGFLIRVRRGSAYLMRPKQRGSDMPAGPATITARFPPQHIAEEWYPVQDPSACMPNMPCFQPVSRARLSGPSQIVFSLDVASKQWMERPLSIAMLTEWAELAMAVDDRALPASAGFEEQMKNIDDKGDVGLTDALARVRASLQPPGAAKTQLELTGRLLFSPSDEARWVTPRKFDPRATPLWTARLDEVGRASVRALWSRYMLPGKFKYLPEVPKDNPRDPCNGAGQPAADRLLVLESKHHWGLIGQTSVYGLPALRRISDGSQGDPADQALQKLPRSRVVRALREDGSPYRMLSELDWIADPTSGKPDFGIALSAPFNDADVIMTGLGGIIAADWHTEPATIKTKLLGEDAPESFELERFGYRSYLGRDVRVEAVEKGYLLPLGIRSSCVSLTERLFFRHPDFGSVYAIPVQRRFIVVQKPLKTLPGVNQPYASRDFPAQRIVMHTRVTPDLFFSVGSETPIATWPNGVEVFPGGHLRFPAQRTDEYLSDATIFFPRVSTGLPGTPGDVDFRWSVDDEPKPTTSNLLFVSNLAITHEQLMGEIVQMYRSLDTDVRSLRTARVGGARRRYAPTESDGETTFDTNSWLMSARGQLTRDQQGAPIESFVMDGRMEGADQPPCYPVMEQAKVHVQSLDRLIGRPLGLIDVGFNPTYVTDGFGGKNPADIYLNLLGPDIELNVTGQSTTTGGVAQPNALAVALSRKTGVIGGTKAAAPKSSRALVGANSQPAPYSFEKAEQGKFAPAEFLGGIAKARILGLIELKDVLREIAIDFAPKLVETVGYGMAGAEDELLDRIKTLLCGGTPSLLDRLRNNLTVFGQKINEPILKKADHPELPHDYTYATLNPALNERFKAFDQAVRSDMEEICRAQQVGQVLSHINTIVISARPFLAEIERTLRDPVPPLIKNLTAQLTVSWSAIKDKINGDFISLGRELARQLADGALKTFCQQIDASGLAHLLLAPEQGVTCEDIVANPEDGLGRLQDALFEQVAGEPLRRALTLVRDYQSQVTARIAWAEQRLGRAVLSIIVAASYALQDRLEPPQSESDVGNILAPPARIALREAIMQGAGARLAPILAGDPAAASLEVVRGKLEAMAGAIATALPSIAADVRAAVQAQAQTFKAKVGEDPAAIIDAFLQDSVPDIVAVIGNDLNERVEKLRRELMSQLDQMRAVAINRIGDMTGEVFKTVSASALYARIAEAGRAAQQWCDQAANQIGSAKAIAFADDVAQGLLMADAKLTDELVKIQDASSKLTVPLGTPGNVAIKFEELKRAVLAAIQQLALIAQRIVQARAQLQQVRQNIGTACVDVSRFLDPVQALVQLRQQALSRIEDIVARLIDIELLLSDFGSLRALDTTRSQVQPTWSTQDVDTVIAEILQPAAALVQGVTSIAQVGISAVWRDIETLLAAMQSAGNAEFKSLRDIPEFTATLQQIVLTMQRTAADLRDRFSQANLTTGLVAELTRLATFYVRESEKRLAAHILQSITLSADGARQMLGAAASALAALASQLLGFQRPIRALLEQLIKLLTTGPLGDILPLLLANDKVIDELKNSLVPLDADQQTLEAIVTAADPLVVLAQTQTLLNRWYPNIGTPPGPALVAVLTHLANLAEAIVSSDLGEALKRFGASLLESLVADLKLALEQLVPTRLDLEYEWKTELGEFPSGDYVFGMLGGSHPNDLTITATVAANFLTGARTASVRGKLRPFEIWLVGSSIDVARIQFAGATFTSVNGSAPKFEAQIQTVILGELVEFIKPLQAWLSPTDGGFYLKPIFSPIGLEVGYTYDAGVIQVGTLQFINVAIGAAARLPFNGDEAEFEFHFASEERPFLIAQPPYGGGGHVQLIANARSIKGFSLSAQFGAVVAIKFGPLRAQGRVTAGIYLASRQGGGREIAAFVEAVGEGNIACFSISIFIQVGLRQISEGENTVLYGFSTYRFTFKVGFVKVRLGFTARYTVKGDKRSNSGGQMMLIGATAVAAQPMLAAIAGPDPRRRYVTRAPKKATQWRSYRARQALNLL